MRWIALLLAFAGFEFAIASPQLQSPNFTKIVASTNSIPTVFSQAAGSKALTGNSGKYSHIRVSNQTTSQISFVSSNDCTVNPSSASSQRLTVEAGEVQARDDLQILDCVFIQSEASTISAGNVSVELW